VWQYSGRGRERHGGRRGGSVRAEPGFSHERCRAELQADSTPGLFRNHAVASSGSEHGTSKPLAGGYMKPHNGVGGR
jgi:hypothetical protein